MDLTLLTSELTQYDETMDLSPILESGYQYMQEYIESEFSGERRRGFFEPQGGPGTKRFKIGHNVVYTGVAPGSVFPQNKMTKYVKKKQVTYKGKSRKSLASDIKKISLRNAETKNYFSGTSGTLLHAQAQGFGLTQGIIQGTSVTTRVGDEIFLNHLRANVVVTAPPTAGAYSYRIQLLTSGEEYSSTTFTTTTLAFNEVFLPTAVLGYNVAGVVNRKAVKIIMDQVISINSLVAATQDLIHFPINVPLKNVKFPYQQGGSVYGKTTNLYFLVTPYVAGGTAATTACGTIAVNFSLDFKDL